VVKTGARAFALLVLLERAGFRSAPPVAAPRITGFPPSLRGDVYELYRTLGGTQASPTLRPNSWDISLAGGLVVELDEELHFNEYRLRTLQAPWYSKLQWVDTYRLFCARHAAECLASGTWGKRWTTPGSVRQFGGAAEPGDLSGAGSPRWKQRALYDAIKDAAVSMDGRTRLVRVSIYDRIDGMRLGAMLSNNSTPNLRELASLVEQRATPALLG
jgi:hypothetical protein